MNALLKKSAADISMNRLPVLPGSLFQLLETLADDDIQMADLARIMGRFPSITVRLISVANSALYSPVSAITSVEAACTRLGLAVVRSIGIALAVAQPFNPAHCPPFNVRQLWANSLMRGEAASKLAQLHARDEIATARTAALISNIGLLWMADSSPYETAEAIYLSRDDANVSVNDALVEIAGIDYGQIGADLACHWKLPTMLCDAIANQHANHPGTHQTSVSSIVASSAKLTHFLFLEDEAEDFEPPVVERIHGQSTDSMALLNELEPLYKPTLSMAESLFG